MTHGRHQLSFGAWFQPFQSNETIALSQYGQATFSELQASLQGAVATFSVRSLANRDELAVAVRRLVRRGRDSCCAAADSVAGLPGRIHNRME